MFQTEFIGQVIGLEQIFLTVSRYNPPVHPQCPKLSGIAPAGQLLSQVLFPLLNPGRHTKSVKSLLGQLLLGILIQLNDCTSNIFLLSVQRQFVRLGLVLVADGHGLHTPVCFICPYLHLHYLPVH